MGTLARATLMAFVVFAGHGTTAVAAQAPARDRPSADKGTATIAGVVVDTETARPLGRVNVVAIGPVQQRTAQTDADGRFVLTDLAAGTFTLNASKAGYISPTSANPRQRPTTYTLAEGQALEKVVITLTRGGVISGRLVDERGDPLEGAMVQTLRFRYADGQRRLMPIGGPPTITDDLGGFRLYGLPPGDVYVGVLPRREYLSYVPASPEAPTYTFYPGTINGAEAKPIAVRAGRETSGVVFPISIQRFARIEGRVVSASIEQFGNWMVYAYPIDSPAPGQYGLDGGSVRPDGTFQMRVPPGTYGLEARPHTWPQQTDVEIARAIVTVDGVDLTGVALSAGRGGLARGRIVMDDGSAPSFSVESVRVSAASADPRNPFRASASASPNLGKDWTFEIGGLGGATRLSAGPVVPTGGRTATWAFKAALLGDRDVTDSGIEFRPGETVEGVRLVLTRKPTQLTGRLDPDGNPLAAAILAFAADESRWSVPSRYVLGARPSPDGVYSIALVPDIEYLVVAVDDIEDGQWSDLGLLRAVRHRATRITLADGESRSHNLSIVDWRK